MESIQKKKGMSIGDMYPAVLTIVLIGIVLGVGLFVLSTLHDSIATSYDGTQDNINATSGTTVLTDAALTEFYLSNTPTLIVNNATATAYTNFTCTTAGTCTWGGDIIAGAVTGDLHNISYTYNYDATNSPEEGITTSITGLATFADWIAIIVVVIAAAIVLGIVLSSFGRRRNTI